MEDKENNIETEDQENLEIHQLFLEDNKNDHNEIEKRIFKVYEDTIHQNYGTPLNGGIKLEDVWQDWLMKLASKQSRRYLTPKGMVGKRFVDLLSFELAGIMKRNWNDEIFLIFQIVILQRTPDITSSSEIRRIISHRLDKWQEKLPMVSTR